MSADVELPVSRHGTLTRRLLAGYGVGIFVFLFAPIVMLILFSFNESRIGAFPITGLTTKWYGELGNDVELQEAFKTSIEVAFQVTLLSVAVGTAAAFPLARSRMRFRHAARVGLLLPIMLPGLLIGVSLLILFTTVLDIELSSRTAVIGQSIFTTPFVVLLLSNRLQTLDRKLEWAASDLGADALRRFRYVILPELMPAMLAAGMLTFALSLDEFIITLFVIGGDETLPLYVFNHVRAGITPAVNAVATLFLLASSVLVVLAFGLPSVMRRLRRLRAAVRTAR